MEKQWTSYTEKHAPNGLIDYSIKLLTMIKKENNKFCRIRMMDSLLEGIQEIRRYETKVIRIDGSDYKK